MNPVDLTETFRKITTYWEPRIAGELNGQHVKCVKLKGEFVWHHHAEADELFYIHRGRLQLRLRTGVVELAAGQFYIVPRGVEHQPAAEDEVEVVLFEPAGTLNTGNVRDGFTKDELARI